MKLSMTMRFGLCLSLFFGSFTFANHNDPCGMVPPVYVGDDVPISRIGLQKTYVFYKDGVETFVIRPGFRGNIDNFGMLIPFPTPPSLRKVPDNVFGQIANAVDPPEVVVDLRARRSFAMGGGGGFGAPGAMRKGAGLRSRDFLSVVKEEAVGMYQVAVLQAGSPEALKRWMEKNGYQYPEGMDKVTNDYIADGWCFVAVKTQVGQKKNVEPKPGQRSVDPKLPSGSVFDGHVQGMGFRFKSDELVVPMRLSAFNKGELRNVVYLLTEGPRKIRAIPEEYVVRQIRGKQLYKNLTEPLPLRVIGGKRGEIPQYLQEGLAVRRNPEPKNGMAKELFANDLLSVSTGNLSLEHEETEKQLLQVAEHFGLRGPEIDRVHQEALKADRDKTTQQGIAMLDKMTLTVVDGDFPRNVIANQNLTFAEYRMPAKRNNNRIYDANQFGPGSKKEGVLMLGALNPTDQSSADPSVPLKQVRQLSQVPGAALPVETLGMVRKSRASAFWYFVAMCLVGCLAWVGIRLKTLMLTLMLALCNGENGLYAQETRQSESLQTMISRLGNDKTAKPTLDQIADYAKANESVRLSTVEALVSQVHADDSSVKKGWAIAALAKIGGQDMDERLLNIQANEKLEMAVRTYAAAARVSMTQSVNGLIEKAALIPKFPSLGRPIGVRLIEQITKKGETVDPGEVIATVAKVPQLQKALAPSIIAMGPKKLVPVVYEDSDNQIRRLAAGYLGTIAQKGGQELVESAVCESLKFDPDAKSIPWEGGALFVPGIQWKKKEARQLVGNLIRWLVWCEMHDLVDESQQIHNNIRSLSLARAAGYKSPGWNTQGTESWLAVWGKAVGHKELDRLLNDVGAQDNDRFRRVLEQVR